MLDVDTLWMLVLASDGGHVWRCLAWRDRWGCLHLGLSVKAKEAPTYLCVGSPLCVKKCCSYFGLIIIIYCPEKWGLEYHCHWNNSCQISSAKFHIQIRVAHFCCFVYIQMCEDAEFWGKCFAHAVQGVLVGLFCHPVSFCLIGCKFLLAALLVLWQICSSFL